MNSKPRIRKQFSTMDNLGCGVFVCVCVKMCHREETQDLQSVVHFFFFLVWILCAKFQPFLTSLGLNCLSKLSWLSVGHPCFMPLCIVWVYNQLLSTSVPCSVWVFPACKLTLRTSGSLCYVESTFHFRIEKSRKRGKKLCSLSLTTNHFNHYNSDLGIYLFSQESITTFTGEQFL